MGVGGKSRLENRKSKMYKVKKSTYRFSLIVVGMLLSFVSIGQQQPKYKVAVFAPLYLDSAFDSNFNYRFSKNNFPKYINPGLEFYEGVQLALDSLNKARVPMEVFIYDTKSKYESLDQQLSRPELDDVQLIIAHSANNEIKTFAEAALNKSVPVINVNLPNDGGVSENPLFVILNPTLRTQAEGIYKYLQKNHSIDPIVVFRKKGQLEDRIQMHFEDYAKSTASVPLKIKYVDLPDNFGTAHLRVHLDTVEQ